MERPTAEVISLAAHRAGKPGISGGSELFPPSIVPSLDLKTLWTGLPLMADCVRSGALSDPATIASILDKFGFNAFYAREQALKLEHRAREAEKQVRRLERAAKRRRAAP